MTEQPPLWRRLAGFTMLPAIAAVSPLLVLPIVARRAGQDGWSSAIAGEAVGTFAAIVIGYGWSTIGPALVSIARDDTHRGRLYRDAVVIRLLIAAAALPLMAIACWLVAAPGSEWLSVLMGLQGALIALTFTWFAVGVGDPRSIIGYDAIPRLVAAALAAVAIIAGAPVELYPLTGIAVTVVGTSLYTIQLLGRFPATWPTPHDLGELFRIGAPVALNDAALGAYSSVPAPVVTLTSPAEAAAGYASADKMLKLGQFLPLTLANALQSWVGEAHGVTRRHRTRTALIAHVILGVGGGVAFAVLGSWASTILFGAEAAASPGVVAWLGLSFLLFSVRTSMTRHILFPAGQSHRVMWATVIGTAVGVPAMILLAHLAGPIGVAAGYALTEIVATTLLIRPTRSAIKRLDHAKPVD